MSDRPGIIWIASYPKSGNTWTRALLHNLIGTMYGESDGPQSINKMTKFTSWEISAKLYEKYLGKPAKEADRAEIAAVRPKVQAQIADRGDGLALIKTHNALVVDRGVPTINFCVTSGAIYIVRIRSTSSSRILTISVARLTRLSPLWRNSTPKHRSRNEQSMRFMVRGVSTLRAGPADRTARSM